MLLNVIREETQLVSQDIHLGNFQQECISDGLKKKKKLEKLMSFTEVSCGWVGERYKSGVDRDGLVMAKPFHF